MNNVAAKPTISVCVVTYNQEKYIGKCIQSILDQDCECDLEIIVGDDCSTDSTLSIVDSFSEKATGILKIVSHKKNIGGMRNYLEVHRMSSGEFVAHMDGDDYWHPDKLRKQLEFFRENSSCVAVYTNAEVVDGKNNHIGKFNNVIPCVFDINYLLEKGNFLNHSSFMYKSFIQSSIMDIDGDAIDYKIHLRCAGIGHLGYVNSISVGYRMLSSSVSSTASKEVAKLYWDALIEANRVNNATPQALRKAFTDFFASVIYGAIGNRQFSNIGYWLKRIKYDTGFSSWAIFTMGLLSVPKKAYYSLKRKALPKLGLSIVYSAR